jgi:hypothetical protein
LPIELQDGCVDLLRGTESGRFRLTFCISERADLPAMPARLGEKPVTQP